MVNNGCEREFTYVYGAVSPVEGDLDWMLCSKMNTEEMGRFLAAVSAAHPDEFMLMVIDGASSHVAKALVVPENIRPFDCAQGTRSIGCHRMRRNSIRRSTSGMNYARRNFPTVSLATWRAWSNNSKKVCLALLLIRQ